LLLAQEALPQLQFVIDDGDLLVTVLIMEWNDVAFLDKIMMWRLPQKTLLAYYCVAWNLITS